MLLGLAFALREHILKMAPDVEAPERDPHARAPGPARKTMKIVGLQSLGLGTLVVALDLYSIATLTSEIIGTLVYPRVISY